MGMKGSAGNERIIFDGQKRDLIDQLDYQLI
jgi:hypothetical protein